jgi:hypothetical protein
MVNLLFLLACNDAPTDPGDAALPTMSDAQLLTRASLDLRGVRPTSQELDLVEADASELDGLLDTFLNDERFERRVLELYSDVYLTRADGFEQYASQFGLDDQAAFERAVGEEPLRIIARVAAEDLPWTEIVTADWTMANEVTAAMWPLDYPAGGSGWQVAHYTDDRPAAGVLSATGMWWRYSSTDSNANRKRANAASRILLCNDYLVRPIDFDRDVDLLDEDAVADAIANNPACASCHDSLDPLAGYFFGFWSYLPGSSAEAGRYHPEREHLWQDYTGVAPAYYGEPGDNLGDLGRQIAADPRFGTCAVEQVFEALLRRDATIEDTEALNEHREAFIAGGLRMRPLIRSVLDDSHYRAGATETTGAVPTKLVGPDLLASQVEELTGFRWEYAGYDMLGTDLYGLRTLAGGADGRTVSASATVPNATLLLVQERLAEAAADHVVRDDLSVGIANAHLFTVVTPDASLDDRNAVTAQIQALHRSVFGRRVDADGEEVAANLGLLDDLVSVGADPQAAWTGLVAALLRDPDFLLY